MKITFVLDRGDNLSGGYWAIARIARGTVQLRHHVTLTARPQRRRGLRERARQFLEGNGATELPARPSHLMDIGVELGITGSRALEDAFGRVVQNARGHIHV